MFQENILEMIMTFFPPAFSFVPTWYCNSNQAVPFSSSGKDIMQIAQSKEMCGMVA